MTNMIDQVARWANENAGFVALVIAVASGVFGFIVWLRRRPKFNTELIVGPTFVNTTETEKTYNGFPTHRTAFVLYLQISNRGRAASSIAGIEMGYHNFTFRHTFQWYWLQPTPIRGEVTRDIGDSRQHFPFLLQRSTFTGENAETFLDPGKSTNGVVYFEQVASWGGWRPRRRSDGAIRVRVRIRDGFGCWHTSTHNVRYVDLDTARSFCAEFGRTYESAELQTPSN